MKTLQNTTLALFSTLVLVSFACSADESIREAEPGAAAPASTPAETTEAVQDSKPAANPVARPAYDATHGLWSEILEEHVKGDNFDYEALKEKPERLERYLAQLQSVSKAQYDKWKENEQMAFWINVYNAHAIKLVIDHYPVDSIRDIGTMLNRVWNKRFIDMPDFDPEEKQRQLSLDDVEHKILRPKFQDARVHAAVNCASESCPPLRAEAFTAKKLDDQLTEQVRAWLADPSRNKFDQTENAVELSKIFDWFKDDFLNPRGGVLTWIAAYVPEETSQWIRANKDKIKIGHLDYSWKLNAVER